MLRKTLILYFLWQHVHDIQTNCSSTIKQMYSTGKLFIQKAVKQTVSILPDHLSATRHYSQHDILPLQKNLIIN